MGRKEPASWGDLSGFVEVRPLSQRVAVTGAWNGYRSSPFAAGLGSTLKVLRREVAHLAPKRVILEADFREDQLRLDGLPKANARPASEAIILTLVGTRHGDLRYPCNSFGYWDENLRAIALALEALRKVDRYGVTRRGEQYAGWKALPAGSSPDVERGRELIREHGGVREALKAVHPDTGGNHEDLLAVQAARDAAVTS
jgi:hypothetical protein